MITDVRQLDKIKASLSDLRDVLFNLSSGNEEYFSKLESTLSKASSVLQNFISTESVNAVTDYSESVAQRTAEMSEQLDGFYRTYQGFDSNKLTDALDPLRKKVGHVTAKLDDMGGPPKRAIPGTRRDPRKPQKGKGLAEKEVSSFMGKMQQFGNTLKIPVAGSIMAGLTALAAYGVSEQQRLKAETGEAFDILIASSDAAQKQLVDRTSKKMGEFQEHLRVNYLIDRKDYQASVSEFVKGGISIREWTQKTVKGFGDVGENVASLALGFDKALNVGSGTTAAKMVKYSEEYGMSLKASSDTMFKMATLGMDDSFGGIGPAKFIKYSEDAAESLRNLGFGLESSATLFANLGEAAKEAGLPNQMSAKYFSNGLTDLGSGLSNVSDEWAAYIGSKMGLGTGISAVIGFRTLALRLGSGKDTPEEAQDFILKAVEAIHEITGDSEDRLVYMLRTMLSLSDEGAVAALNLWKVLKTEGVKSATAGGKESRKLLKTVRDSFKTDRDKRTGWEQAMTHWMKGMSFIGTGIMSLMAKALGQLVLFFRAVPSLFVNIFKGKDGVRETNRILNVVMSEIPWDNSEKGTFAKGMKHLKKAGQIVEAKVIGDSIDMVRRALTVDLRTGEVPDVDGPDYDGITSGREDYRAGLNPGGVFSVTPPPTVQVVVIPAEAGTTAIGTDVLGMDYGDFMKKGHQDMLKSRTGLLEMAESGEHPTLGAGKSLEELAAGYRKDIEKLHGRGDWKGNKNNPLRIVVFGMRANGDMEVGLVGECPKCGLSYDQNQFKEEMLDKAFKADPVNVHGFAIRSDKAGVNIEYHKEGDPVKAERRAESLRKRDALTVKNQEVLDSISERDERDKYIAAMMLSAEGVRSDRDREDLMQTVINRKGDKDMSLESIITGGKGLGAQQEYSKDGKNHSRAYSTYGVDPESKGFKRNLEWVNKNLDRITPGGLGGATHFLDQGREQKAGGKWAHDKKFKEVNRVVTGTRIDKDKGVEEVTGLRRFFKASPSTSSTNLSDEVLALNRGDFTALDKSLQVSEGGGVPVFTGEGDMTKL